MDKNYIRKIKSIYIFKKIFSFLSEYIKLDLIQYNIKSQKKLQISIEDYKNKCKIYRTIWKNGKGKEFDIFTNNLIFEGEYKNGRKNGKGKEYYNNKHIKFEGEYLSGKKIEGKEYDINGNLVLILEKNGDGKEFYKNEYIQFKGKYYNGKRWNGELIDYINNEEYEIKYGKGWYKEYHFNGEIKFEGEYVNGEIIYGKEYNENGKLIYEGEFSKGERNGNGREYYIDGGLRSEGEYYHGKLRKGKEYNCNGKLLFEGEYKNGKRNGKGKEYNIKSRVRSLSSSFDDDEEMEFDLFLDMFMDNLVSDNTQEVIFEGEYLNGERWNGKGTEFYDSGNIKYEGEYTEGKTK